MSAPKLSLISASPSPYARKVRIALAEKGIPFELHTEVPWDDTTQTPRFNPLEKLPILLVPKAHASSQPIEHLLATDDATPIYESHFILDWLETKHPEPALVPSDPDLKLAAKQVEVIADGMCDALVLRFFETQRAPERQSQEWLNRQERKIGGGLRWLDERVKASGANGSQRFLVGQIFGLADIAAGCILGYSEYYTEEWSYNNVAAKLVPQWTCAQNMLRGKRTTQPLRPISMALCRGECIAIAPANAARRIDDVQR